MALLLGSILGQAAAAVPGRVAATLDDEVITFGQLDAQAGRMANALAALGIGRGDRVLCWIDLSLRCHELFFALARIGAAFVPVNPAGSPEEIGSVAAYVRPALMIVDAAHLQAGETLARNCAVPLAVLGASGPVPGADLDGLCGLAAAVYSGETPQESDPHVIFLTSGSTGQPKGVVISQRAGWLRANSFETQGASGGGGDVNMFPLFHMAGWTQITSSLIHLRANHLVRRAEAGLLLQAVERWQARRIYCIPAVWERVLASDDRFDTSSLRHVLTGTYRVDPALMAAITQRFPGAHRQVIYGSTEVGIAMALDDDEIDSHPDAVGLPVRGVSARISADGELEIACPTMMDGYFDLPEQTADVLRDGWYRSGDLAEQEADGVYHIVGRAREVIRTGGETVAPAEVEAAILTYPGIAQAAIVGLPDTTWGEIVCAALVMHDGAPLPPVEALRAHLASRLAPFKHPRRVESVADMPRTSATQQLQRGRVKEVILTRLAGQPQEAH